MSLDRDTRNPGTTRTPGRTLGVVGLAALAMLALSGCGADLNPGSAVSVNNNAISQDEVDDLVGAACEYIEINNATSNQPVPIAISDLRATVTGALVSFDLIDSAIEEFDLTILPANVEAAAAQNPLPDGLSEAHTALLDTFFYDGAKAQIQQATLGAHLQDDSVTTSADVTVDDASSAADYMEEYLAAADVEVNPGYGSWDGSVVTSGSGSLSDGVSDEAKARIVDPESEPLDVSALPPSQVCG